jgi:hypothetical protein
MKKLLFYTLLIFLANSVFADSKKTDFSKMSEKELMAYFMETHKKKKEALIKLKKSEEELAKTKKLGKTLDELNGMLGIKE